MSRRLLPSKLDTKPRRRRRNSTAERTRAQNAEDLKDNGEDGKSPSGAFTLLLSSKSSKVDQTAKSSTIQGTAKTEILHPNVPSTINETDRFDKENANFLSSIFPMEPSNQDQTQNAWGREDSCETFEKVNLSIVRPPQAYDSSDDIYSPRIPVPSLETFQMNTTENSRSRAISSLDKTYDDQNSSFDTVATKHTSKKEDPPSTSHASPPGSPRIDESLEPNINRTVGGSTDDDHVSKGTGSPATPSSRNTDLSQADPGLSTDKLSTEDDDDLSPIRPLSIPFQTNDTEKLSKRENNGDGPKETKTISHPDRNDSNGLSPNEVLSSLNVYSPSHASKIPSHPDDESTMLSLQPEDVLLYVTRDNSELLAENIQQQTQELDYKSDSEYSASTATQQYSPFHEKNNMLSPSFSGDEDHDSVFKSTGKQIRQRRDSFKDSGEDDDDDDLSWINRPVNSLQGITQQPYSRRRRSNGTIESIDTTDPLSPPSPKRKTNGLVDDEGASMTFAYKNSVEKEVENVIKDLFFIGSENLSKPGRQERKEEVVFSPTHETASVDTDGLSLSSASSSTSTAASLIRHEKESNNDPVVAILGGVSAALSDVLGITLEGDGEESDDYSESAASTIAFSSIRNAMNIGGVVNYATEKILRPAAAEAGDIMLGVHNASKKRRPQKKKKSRSLRRSKSDVVATGRNNEFNEEYRSRHERVSRAVAASGDTNVEPNEIVTKKKYSKTKQVSRTVATAETNDMQAGQRRGELTRVNRNKEEIQTIKMAFSQGEKLEKVNKKILSETEYFSRIVASTETGNMRADPPHGDLVRVVKERREKTNTIKSTTLLDPIIAKSLGEWKIGESVRRGTEEEELNNSVLEFDKPLEDDPRLADLALHTAQSIHMSRGVKLNHATDFFSELEFKVVRVAMPLGVMMQNNPGGCWVAEIFPYGNAVNCLEVGDQIAAIDGRSAIQMTVQDICDLLLRISNEQDDDQDDNLIELTILRYTGELHPIENEIEVPSKITTTTTTAPNQNSSPKGKENMQQRDSPSSNGSTEVAHICTQRDDKKKRFNKWLKRTKRKTSRPLILENSQQLDR